MAGLDHRLIVAFRKWQSEQPMCPLVSSSLLEDRLRELAVGVEAEYRPLTARLPTSPGSVRERRDV